MAELPRTERTTVRRLPQRGRYDTETLYAILDEALVCHLGFVGDGGPVVLPTLHVRVGDHLYVHGSALSAMLLAAGKAPSVCVTVTLLDGLVLARSAFHHSVNYRSAVVFGQATEVTDRAGKREILDALVEHVVPGRVRDCRAPSEGELDATCVLQVPLREASAKVREGMPVDAPEDRGLEHWAGVVPLRLVADAPQSDEHVPDAAPMPSYLKGYRRG